MTRTAGVGCIRSRDPRIRGTEPHEAANRLAAGTNVCATSRRAAYLSTARGVRLRRDHDDAYRLAFGVESDGGDGVAVLSHAE